MQKNFKSQGKNSKQKEKDERRAAALRTNLRRRKIQMRGRSNEETDKTN